MTNGARRVFYSFYFRDDVHRAARVRAIGEVAGNPQESDSRWEQVKQGGDDAIQAWIDEQMTDMSCLIVLIGCSTAGRRWVSYEIGKAWQLRKGILGIHVHRLLDAEGKPTAKGADPFAGIVFDGIDLTQVVKTYDPPHLDADDVYDYIGANLASWVEKAIESASSLSVPSRC